MILAAAVCPPVPALLPEVGRGLPEIEPTRVAAGEAVIELIAERPERVVIIGPDSTAVDGDESAGGSFLGFGVDCHVGGSAPVLPASYAVGAWLLDQAGWSGPRHYTSSSWTTGPRDALLVMADSDTSAGVSAPTHGDPRAAAHDEVIASALAAGDPAPLAALDPRLAAQWEGTGVAPLQRLGSVAVEECERGASITAQLRCDEAPFGVRYWVANWTFRP